jgi:hypothetical protein
MGDYMKILIQSDGPHAHYYIRLGLARAFEKCGHKPFIWDINQKPATDMFDEFEPDIFIGQTYNLTPTIIKLIEERPHLKVEMKAADWGNFAEEFPVLRVTEQEARHVQTLRERTGKPDYLHIHYHHDYVSETHKGWIERGFKVYSQLSAADVFDYTGGTNLPEFQTDLAFIGGYWGYKSQVLNSYFLPLCNSGKYKIRIYGNSPWPVPQYCGPLQSHLSKHALASAKICPSLHEPHSQVYGHDIVERPYKLLANKCFVVSDYVEGLAKLDLGIPMAKSPEEFENLIDHYLKNPNKAAEIMIKGFQKVLINHTYFNRIEEIFTRLGLPDQAKEVENIRRSLIR